MTPPTARVQLVIITSHDELGDSLHNLDRTAYANVDSYIVVA
jgi:hypothetical protein